MGSLRDVAAEILTLFRRRIQQFSDFRTLEHISAVFDGNARSLLDFETRPSGYDDVGRTIDWGRRRMRRLSRSKYEKIIHRAVSHEPLRIAQKRHRTDRITG